MRNYRESRVKVTDEIKKAILDLIDEEQDFERKKKHSAIWYQEKVAERLKLTDNDNPSLRTYESLLQPIRKALQVNNPEDKPWCLASLSKYPLPLEAIPTILLVQHNVQSHRNPKVAVKPKEGQPVTGSFTIREAQWVARLKFIEDIVTLEHWAHAYAIAERASAIIDRDFDSSEMDKAILNTYHHQVKKKAGNYNEKRHNQER